MSGCGLCVCTYVCVRVHVWRSGDSFQELILSFNHGGSVDPVQIVKHSGNHRVIHWPVTYLQLL